MSRATRDGLERWLGRNGFALRPGGSTSHRQWGHHGSGVKVTVPGHGPRDLSDKWLGVVVRAVARAGFDRKRSRQEIEAS